MEKDLKEELERIERNIRSLSMEEFEGIIDKCGINREEEEDKEDD